MTHASVVVVAGHEFAWRQTSYNDKGDCLVGYDCPACGERIKEREGHLQDALTAHLARCTPPPKVA